VMIDSGLLVRYDQGSDVVYSIEANKQAIASYYRNSVAHHFVNKSIIELSLLNAIDQVGSDNDASAVFWQEASRLRDLFKFEFFYPPTDEFVTQLEDELSRSDIDLKKIPDQRNTGPKSVLLGMHPLMAHSTLRIFVEAYTVVLDLLTRLAPDQGMDEKTCVMRALKEGQQALLQRRITSEASIGKILFQNGYKLASHLGLTDAGGEELVAKRAALLREFKELSLRLERIAIMARYSRMTDDEQLAETVDP
jgi:glycerol-3-phosphate O-acyltransferase